MSCLVQVFIIPGLNVRMDLLINTGVLGNCWHGVNFENMKML